MSDTSSTWTMSNHALKRAAERGVEIADLHRILARPAYTYPQTDLGPDRRMYVGEGFAIAVNTATHTVVTIVYQDQSRWDRAAEIS
jgi:hypothetical protein